MVRFSIMALLAACVVAIPACAEAGNREMDGTAPGADRDVAASLGALDSTSARAFVAAFYSRYLESRRDLRLDAPAWHVVLNESPEVFSEQLLLLLRREKDRWAAAPEGVIAAIDFDPILGTQDPCDKYEQGGVGTRDSLVSVELRCASPSSVVEVVAELEHFMNSWRIVDFYYPTANKRLTSILDQ